jgi:hypothetical protein
MADTAANILEEQIEWAQDRMLYLAIDHITENLDDVPGVGIGLSFMKRSAEKMIVQKLENEIVPDIEEHIQLHMAYVRALADADDTDAVTAEYRDRLLATDPFLKTLDAPDDKQQELTDQVARHHEQVAVRAAQWIEEAGDRTFNGYADMVVSLGKTADEIAAEIRETLRYVEWIEEHREHVDMSGYSSVLEHSTVHQWFLDTLIAGLEEGRSTVIAEVREQVEERQEME